MARFDGFVFSAGGFGREVAWVAARAGFKSLAFIDDEPAKQGQILNGCPVISLDQACESLDVPVINAVGSTVGRMRVAERLRKLGFKAHGAVSPTASVGPDNEVDPSCIICDGVVITCNTKIGRGVNINLNSTVGHDTIIDEFVSIAPGANVAGCVEIGANSYIGTGSSIINGTQSKFVKIGKNATVGAGAVVVKDVPDNVIVAGVPARIIREVEPIDPAEMASQV